MSQSILVIGYGNDLRSDDGVGQKVAEAIASGNLANNVRVLCVHQLTPELVAFLANADLAIFIDACFSNICEVQVQAIKPVYSTAIAGHISDPRSLLALTQVLYSHVPIAWWVQIPGVNFELGEVLSPISERGIQAALAQINNLIKLGRIEQCMKLA